MAFAKLYNLEYTGASVTTFCTTVKYTNIQQAENKLSVTQLWASLS